MSLVATFLFYLIQSTSLELPIPYHSSIPMGRTTTTTIKIIKESIHTFLNNYFYYTNQCLLALPFSSTILLSSPGSISLQNTIQFRLLSLFDSVGFPTSNELFSIFTLKLSQTITSSIQLLSFT
ncbi:hypothetical protein HanPI659440_Chr04g0153631 [Helianthus annuus]|uniref:Uncharacterized protein n=1 Tax=Helianthus annuus TaxID=4232 RepID=A0A9K3J7P5_HELAN|nr:hypothetical protein HanXRQr2_Chr04g0156291 [Helianthus annuus]KAJ0580370.1 hypothetical protein HanHA300_Chr04g0128471 [Helianthus annuus]KAJ0587884.1 hypothetical protein HanIR_Chr04g0168311 [Helianthus annuus]KAJ0596320.1 hypothetical protein HanHA89_Chr04g0141441 [Helianthus annuus]KAJ0756979.1 hypothetical protein HanLR1_Chr04g0133291 [Helianthus annuus]